MTTTSIGRAAQDAPDLEWTVPGWRVRLHLAHLPVLVFATMLAVLWVVDPANFAAKWWIPTFLAAPSIVMSIMVGVVGGARRVLAVSDGLVRVSSRDQGQGIDPRRTVAAVDRLDRSARRWWDPLVTVLLGQRVVRQRGERTPRWIPVAWISRRQLDAFLDEAERIAARA